MYRKLLFSFVTAAMLLVTPITALAQVDAGTEEQQVEAGTTEGTEENVPETALSEGGNASLGDSASSSDDKEFITVKSKNGNTYYLIIDHQRETDNVYFLNQVDDSDLADFAEESESSAVTVGVQSSAKPEETVGDADSKEQATASDANAGVEEQKEASAGETVTKQSGISKQRNLIIIGVAVIVLIVAMLWKRKKKGTQDDEYENEEEYEGEEDEVEDMEEESESEEDSMEYYTADDFPDEESADSKEMDTERKSTSEDGMKEPEEMEAQSEDNEINDKLINAIQEQLEEEEKKKTGRKRSKRAYRIYLEPEDFEEEQE